MQGLAFAKSTNNVNIFTLDSVKERLELRVIWPMWSDKVMCNDNH
jgi:hypothetical protein